MPDDEQARLMDAIANAMRDVPQAIIDRQVGHFAKADPAYGKGVAERIEMLRAGQVAAE